MKFLWFNPLRGWFGGPYYFYPRFHRGLLMVEPLRGSVHLHRLFFQIKKFERKLVFISSIKFFLVNGYLVKIPKGFNYQ